MTQMEEVVQCRRYPPGTDHGQNGDPHEGRNALIHQGEQEAEKQLGQEQNGEYWGVGNTRYTGELCELRSPGERQSFS